jgi:hypothetical protein
MKTIKTFIFFLFLCAFGVQKGFAQNDLTQEDKQELQERVKLKVEELQGYLSQIVNTSLTDNQRKAAVTSSLALFIGKGQPYSIRNENGENIQKKPVRMQVSSTNRSFTKWLPMTTYLNNQYTNVHKYGKVSIESADVVRVDNIYKVGSGQYQAVAYFCQKYAAYRDGRLVYGDITSKKVIVYISAIETPVGTVWDAKLGDVYVTSTKASF